MLLAGSTRFLFLRARGGRAGAGLRPRWHHFPPRSLGLIRRVCDHVVTGSSMWGKSPHAARLKHLLPHAEWEQQPLRTRHLILLPSLVFPHSDPSNKAMPAPQPRKRWVRQSLGHTAVVWAQGCNHAHVSLTPEGSNAHAATGLCRLGIGSHGCPAGNNTNLSHRACTGGRHGRALLHTSLVGVM